MKDLLRQALEARKRFEFTEGKSLGQTRPWRLTLELPFTREVLKDDGEHTYAEVGATLVLERFGGDLPERYEVVGLGEIKMLTETPESAAHGAARGARVLAAPGVRVRRAAAGGGGSGADNALVQDLQAEDPRVREFALRTLAERRHPAAAPLLDGAAQVDRPGHGAAGHWRAGGDARGERRARAH